MSALSKRVLVFGTFDLLHPGHRSFLRQARRLARELYVVVARDKNVVKLKGYLPVQGEQARLAAVARLPFVTQARLGQVELKHRYELVREIKPDLIALGYDQFLMTENLQVDMTQLGLTVQLVRLKAFRPDLYKSSLLRQRLNKGPGKV